MRMMQGLNTPSVSEDLIAKLLGTPMRTGALDLNENPEAAGTWAPNVFGAPAAPPASGVMNSLKQRLLFMRLLGSM